LELIRKQLRGESMGFLATVGPLPDRHLLSFKESDGKFIAEIINGSETDVDFDRFFKHPHRTQAQDVDQCDNIRQIRTKPDNRGT
jgi:hypothetical protein